MRIGIVTSEKLSSLMAGELLLVEALKKEGVTAESFVWSYNNDLSSYDGLVIRTPWDYYKSYEQFEAWLSAVEASGIRMYNSVETVRWNIHKFYLTEMQRGGIQIVPTITNVKGSTDVSALIESIPWEEMIIKPAISAAASNTYRVSRSSAEAIVPVLTPLFEQKDMLIQKFLPEIMEEGEWSFIFFNKKYSHAIRKVPASGDFRVQQKHGGSLFHNAPGEALIRQAEKAVSYVQHPLLYARVDGVSINGELHLMELELIEPELFLPEHPLAPERLAKAIIEAAADPAWDTIR